ncbi:MAG: glycosyltransferase family 4 protein [Akkermansia muciniphila]|nr:glycosyltransferase family 4 protein [Akkermansia muciniphila]
MKLIHVCTSADFSGVRRFPVDLACRLQAAGASCYLMAPSHDCERPLREAGVVSVQVSMRGGWGWLAAARRLREGIRKVRPDVIQVYDTRGAWTARLACLGMRAAQCPAVVAALPGFRFGGCMARAALRSCRAIAVISGYLRSRLEQSGMIPSGKSVSVIPYGVDEKLVYPGYTPSQNWQLCWKRAQSPAAGELSLCLPAPISPAYGAEQLVPVLCHLRDKGVRARVYLVGDTSRARPAYLEYLRQMFAKAGLDENIAWPGARTDLRDILATCRVTLSLAREPMAYNRAVLEALALGRPVVGFAVGAVGEYLDSFYPAGRVQPGDTGEFAQVLLRCCSSPAPSLASIPYPYTLSNTAQSFLELYRQFV